MRLILLFVVSQLWLSACSNQSNIAPAIPQLSQQALDQKSFATGYQVTLQTYRGQIDFNYPIKDFNQGVADWFAGRYPDGIAQLKQDLYAKGIGYTKTIFSYYSGVIFAAELSQNLNYMGCEKVDFLSLRQGIGEAMQDLQRGKLREDDAYLEQGMDLMFSVCQEVRKSTLKK
ncbi:hypothetical protein CEP45_01010 [Mergibacter septicus]|uniref:hypothetical protein n=1 Tax=Mergibacter septicus TaxID=221402 RepID=UPI001C77AC0C|nr:hypothetical protein [Mergibacter septicus]QDJ12509.1 hypothetical protein CEP45_01010 [Mergibacter septicus]